MIRARGVGAAAVVLVLGGLLAGGTNARVTNPDPAATATRQAELAQIVALQTRIAALETEVAAYSAFNPTPTATFTSAPICGQTVSRWSTATVNGIEGGLAMNHVTPGVYPSYTLTVTNRGVRPFTLGGTVIVVVRCNGTESAPVPADRHGDAPFGRVLDAGAVATAIVTLSGEETATAALILVRLIDDGGCQGQLVFPLRLRTSTTNQVPPLATCAGGTASAGIGIDGADGGDGGDAVGAGTIGGAGCNGEVIAGPLVVGVATLAPTAPACPSG